jgi:hypothetical protein
MGRIVRVHASLERVVELFASDVPVRCWPWERARFYVEDVDLRTESTSDDVWIRGTLTGAFADKRHARSPVSGKVLRVFESTGQRGYLIDAVRYALEDVAERLATRPAYTPPPKGWRKFGRVGR